jgi:hypothetical protein
VIALAATGQRGMATVGQILLAPSAIAFCD